MAMTLSVTSEKRRKSPVLNILSQKTNSQNIELKNDLIIVAQR